jgi:hypothetical protein
VIESLEADPPFSVLHERADFRAFLDQAKMGIEETEVID